MIRRMWIAWRRWGVSPWQYLSDLRSLRAVRTALCSAEAGRDLGADLLKSVRQMKSGNTRVIRKGGA